MENSAKIEGVLVIPLRKIPDDRGAVFHMLRCDAPHFERFGEIYFSTAYPGAIKAWHLHTRMTLNYAVVGGMIKLVLFDARPTSSTEGKVQELFLGQDNYNLVRIPPGIYSGFQCLGTELAMVANCSTEPHDPLEIERLEPASPRIPYRWS